MSLSLSISTEFLLRKRTWKGGLHDWTLFPHETIGTENRTESLSANTGPFVSMPFGSIIFPFSWLVNGLSTTSLSLSPRQRHVSTSLSPSPLSLFYTRPRLGLRKYHNLYLSTFRCGVILLRHNYPPAFLLQYVPLLSFPSSIFPHPLPSSYRYFQPRFLFLVSFFLNSPLIIQSSSLSNFSLYIFNFFRHLVK